MYNYSNPEQKRADPYVFFGRPQLLDAAVTHAKSVQAMENASQSQVRLPDTYSDAEKEALRAAEQTGNADVIDLTKARLLAESLAQPATDNPNFYREAAGL